MPRPADGGGYDRPFYIAIAHDPFLRNTDTAASLDNSLCYRRILYPLTVWLLSAGQPPLLPYALVIINLIAATSLIAVLAQVAARANISPGGPCWWPFSVACVRWRVR